MRPRPAAFIPAPLPLRYLAHRRVLRRRPVSCAAAAPPPAAGNAAAYADVAAAAALAPATPGVYVFRDGAPPAGRALYVGKAVSLRTRLRAYVGRAPAPRAAALVGEARALELLPTASEAAALALEAALVRELQPRWNVLLKDDRRHPYLVLTGGDFPRLRRTWKVPRRLGKRARVYGPFVHEGRLRRVCEAVARAYPLRQRATPLHSDRPCLNHDLGLCAAPCQGLVSRDEYAAMVRQVDMLLTGQVLLTLEEIADEMLAAVEAADFERAAVLRDRRDVVRETFMAGKGDDDSAIGVVEEAAAVASMNDPAAAASRDVVASVAAAGAASAKVALLQVRGGVLVGRLMFSAGAQAVAGGTAALAPPALAAAALAAMLTDHYARARHAMELPEEVVLATPLPAAADARLLASALTAQRGKAVRVVGTAAATRGIADAAVRSAELETRLDEARAVALRSEMESLLDLLAEHYLGLRRGPAFRVESYDISHLGGGHATGSVAVLEDGVPMPREYRRIVLNDSVSSPGRPDDYASIKATLWERFGLDGGGEGHSEGPLPDLIVIDGGKGQLSAAVEAMETLPNARDIPILSLAKRAEEVFVPGCARALNSEVGLTPGVRLLCRARDEAHRNGVTSTRRLHGKAALRSGLDGIPGIGASKRDALLKHFPGGAAAVAVASVDALAETPGIGQATAKRIHDHFETYESASSD